MSYKIFKRDLNEVAANVSNRDQAMLIALCDLDHVAGNVCDASKHTTNCAAATGDCRAAYTATCGSCD